MHQDRTLRHQLTVQIPGYAQRLTQFAGTGAQCPICHHTPPPAHHLQAFQRLECSKQHRAGQPDLLTHKVGTPVHSVREIDVPCSWETEERLIPRVTAMEIPVRGWIIVAEVGLGFYDAAGGQLAID